MLKARDLRGFRTWLEEVASTPLALDWVGTLTDKELEAMMRYMHLQGVIFQGGRPVGDDDRIWEALDEAMVHIHTMREEA